jgi:hypothetical protein
VSDPNDPNNPDLYDLFSAVGDHISGRLSPLLPQRGAGQSAGDLAQEVYDPYLGQYVPAGTPQSDPWSGSRVDYTQGPTYGGNEFDAFDAAPPQRRVSGVRVRPSARSNGRRCCDGSTGSIRITRLEFTSRLLGAQLE